MRLWSIHPSLLDRQGLLALWRESLLAQSIIVKLQNGEKPGYRNHSQLTRFLRSPASLCLIGTYLTFVHQEASLRDYNFNYDKILQPGKLFKMLVTSGQVEYEFDHLQAKLDNRSPIKCDDNLINFVETNRILVHPMFEVMSGLVEEWEKVK